MKLEHEVYPGYEKKREQLEKRNLQEKYWCKLAERLFVESGELGAGQTATVYDSSTEANLCIKRIKQEDKYTHKNSLMNDLDLEAKYLSRVRDLVEEGDEITIPLPALRISSDRYEQTTQINLRGEEVTFDKRVSEEVLVMERINGPSLKDILNPPPGKSPRSFPENFNQEEFFAKVDSFVEKMNNAGIHHRDLHAGNIMIDLDTGNPSIIDFGFSTDQYSPEENVYVENTARGEVRFPTDKDSLIKVKSDVREYFTNE